MLLLVTTACGIFGKSAQQLQQLTTAAAQAQTEVLPSLQAQLTEVSPTLQAQLTGVAPTLQAQMDNLPTAAAGASDSFTDFSAAPDVVLGKIFARIHDLKSYKEDIEVFKGDKSTGKMSFEIVNPDRMHGNIDIEGNQMESIMIGKDFYLKMGDNWMKIDMPMDLSEYAMNFEKYQKDMKDIKIIGPDTVDGHPTMVVQFAYKTDVSDNVTKVWIGMTDGYPYRTETESTVNGETSKVIANIHDFNADITIEAPVQ
jgi:hypothetical protein